MQAKFPAEAQRAGVTASVKMQITIDSDGSVTDAKVTVPAGYGFDEAALEAVGQFRFSPAEVDGKPSPIAIEYVYHFELTSPELPPSEFSPPAGILSGKVVVRGSRSRVGGANVRCGDQADAPEATSREDGHFELSVPSGSCAVRVVAAGFERFQTTETIIAGQMTEVTYYILPKASGYQTVIRADREKKEVARRTLEREEIQKVPGSFGDPIRVIQDLPGVARAPFLSGALIVRGASPGQTGTLMDGVQIPLLYHLGGGPSVVNAEFLDRVDFYPGGFGTHYGRAIGGIVDVATRKGAADTFHGVFKVDLLDTSLFAETPITSNVSAAAAVRRSYVDALIPLVLPKNRDGGTLFVLPRYWDYQVRVDVGAPRNQPPSLGTSTYYIMAFGSDDFLKVIATGGGRDRDINLSTHTLFHRVKGDWTYHKGNLTSVFTPFLGYDLGMGQFGASKANLDDYSAGAREIVSLEIRPWLTARFGVDLLFHRLIGTAEFPVLSGTQFVPFPGGQPQAQLQNLRRTINSFDGAGFIETDFKSGRLTITPGLRFSQSRIHGHDKSAVDPRLWVSYQLNPKSTIKGSLGLYSQPPASLNLDNPPFGNPNLGPERAFQSSLGLVQRITDVIHFDVTGFFNRRYRLVVSPGRDVVNPDGSVRHERFANDGQGRAYGFELLVRHDITRKFFGWLAYTLSRSATRQFGDDAYHLSSFDETHILTMVGSYKLPWGFEFGGRFRYVTGRPRTPIYHPYDTYSADSNTFYGDPGPTRSERLPTFHQLDLRLDKNFVFKTWTLAIYLDVQNVYNAKNTESILYDYRFRESLSLPGIPVLPILGVKASL